MMIYRSIIPIASIVSFRRKDDAAFSRKNGYLVIKLVNGKELVYRNRKDKVTKLCEELERIKNQSIEHIV
jgi:hypothetical protein